MRGALPALLLAVALTEPIAWGETLPIDLSKYPDREALVGCVDGPGISRLRQCLGEALETAWKSSSLRRGKIRPEFENWVDLYGWLALLDSDEASVVKRWLESHVSAEMNQSPSPEGIHLTIHEPGAPLVMRHDTLQHRAVEQLAANPTLLSQALGVLVSRPYEPRNGPIASRLQRGFIEETVGNPRFLKLWTEQYSTGDFAPKVISNLEEIYLSSPTDFREFLELALAISLVRDQPAPDFWPHRQVKRIDFNRVDQSATALFAGYVSAARSGRLLRDPRSLGVRQLMFAVGAPLDPLEIEWARSATGKNRREPPELLTSVHYDGLRMASQSYVWPWGAYRLEEIRKRGGICIDQAYYVSACAGALGIPAMMFAGLGKEGGHAWVGYLKKGGGWDFGLGRPSGHGLVSGETLDPRNWTPVTDHDMQVMMIAENDPAREGALRDLVVAGLFRSRRDASGEGVAIESALTRDPRNPEIWEAREDWLMRTGASLRDLQAHHEAAIKALSYSRDLRARHEQALALLSAKNGDLPAAERLERKILEENGSKRGDLSAAATASVLKGRMEAGDPEGALREYRKQLETLGRGAGGDFFYRVTMPLCGFLNSKNRPDLSRRVIKEAHQIIRPERGSLLDHDFGKLWREAGGLE